MVTKLCSTVLLLGLLFGPAAEITSAQAASPPGVVRSLQAPPARTTVAPAVLTGALQNWFGNRTRMIQFALVAVALGIFILHRK